MHKKALGVSITALIITIALFHYIATIYHLYWIFIWTDIFVHFVGGLWIALASFWIFRFWCMNDTDTKPLYTWLVMVGSTLVIGITWEIFEYYFDIIQYSDSYPLDTFLDVSVGVLGSAAGFIFLNLKKLTYIHNVS